jgi:hypothetical protein
VLISTELILWGTVTYFETLQREHLVAWCILRGIGAPISRRHCAVARSRCFQIQADFFGVLMLHRGPPARWLASEPRLTYVRSFTLFSGFRTSSRTCASSLSRFRGSPIFRASTTTTKVIPTSTSQANLSRDSLTTACLRENEASSGASRGAQLLLATTARSRVDSLAPWFQGRSGSIFADIVLFSSCCPRPRIQR